MKNKGRLVALIVILSLLAIAPGFLMVYISRDAAEKNPASSTTAVYSEEKATNSVPAVEWQRQVTELQYTTVSVLLPPGMDIRKAADGVNHRIYVDHDLLPEEYKDIFASFDLICGRSDSLAPITREAFR